MINFKERENDIIGIISKLDITPTMFKNAEEKYNSLASFLGECGIEADIYPQGSFALGTVVRPIRNNKEKKYDLDFICQIKGCKEYFTPKGLRDKIEDVLTNSDRYRGKLEVYDECFTIEYADINGINFSIDIVPAIKESEKNIFILKCHSLNPELLDTAVAIPKLNESGEYNWIENNPKGFKLWFDNINKPFLEFKRYERRNRIFTENRSIYNSIEEIPTEIERTSLQRAIQILKYHRNIYYSNLKNGDKIKPISAILNTLVAEISKNINPAADTFELLKYVLEELKIYSNYLSLDETKSIIKYDNNEWCINNPANPNDNLADKWNENSEIPIMFFKWIDICYSDLIQSMTLPDPLFQNRIENAFGKEIVRKSFGNKYNGETPKEIDPSKAYKPYRSSYYV